MKDLQCSPDLTNSVLTNHPGLTNQFLTSKLFLLHKNFGFNEYPGIANNCLGPERFVKSGDHCTASIIDWSLLYSKGSSYQLRAEKKKVLFFPSFSVDAGNSESPVLSSGLDHFDDFFFPLFWRAKGESRDSWWGKKRRMKDIFWQPTFWPGFPPVDFSFLSLFFFSFSWKIECQSQTNQTFFPHKKSSLDECSKDQDKTFCGYICHVSLLLKMLKKLGLLFSFGHKVEMVLVSYLLNGSPVSHI